MGIFALVLGSAKPEALMPLLGVSALLACLGTGLIALLVSTVAWLAGVPLEFAQLIATAMTQALIDLGDSWLVFFAG